MTTTTRSARALCTAIACAALLASLQGCAANSASSSSTASSAATAAAAPYPVSYPHPVSYANGQGLRMNAQGLPDVVQAGDKPASEFPDPGTAWQKEGSFPLVDKLRLVGAGMSKDQLYELIGRPHFAEGYKADVWNYIFHFRGPGVDQVVTCQYKIDFDYNKDVEKKLAQQFAWAPAACAERLAPAAVPERIIERIIEKPAPLPAPVPVPVKSRMTLGADGLFAFGKSELSDLQSEGRHKLDDMADKLTQAGVDVTSIVVTGHTDRIGAEGANLALSRARAETVKAYLVRKGVNPTLIRTLGMGEDEPVVQCPGALSPKLIACLQPNRRVDVDVTLLK